MPWKSQVCLVLFLPAAVTSDHEGGCDCYIQGSVAVKTGSVEAQTALKKRQLHTTWEEGLALPLGDEELPTATLTLTLRTCDRFSRHSVIGELRLGLDGTSVPLGAAQWGELKTTAKVGNSQTRGPELAGRASEEKVEMVKQDLEVLSAQRKGSLGSPSEAVADS